jgi:hypothetical protein
MTRYEAGQETPEAAAVGANTLNAKLIQKNDEEDGENITWQRGEVQERSCRDSPFALLFIAMIIAISVVAGVKGFPKMHDDNGNHDKEKIGGVIKFTLSLCAISVVLSGGAVALLNAFAEFFVVVSLIFSIVISIAVGIMCIFAKNYLAMTLAFLLAAVSLCYYCVVQDRIPFATANLRTGVAACRSNLGIFLVAYTFVAGLIFWVFIWMVALFGMITNDETCDGNGKNCKYDVNVGLVFLLAISIFWAAQVFINCIHVTIAGVVGTWWYSPEEASSCCSTAVRGSVFRTLTTSFGSICFGSLLVAIIQAIKSLVESLRRDQDNGCGENFLLCCVECCLSCVENIFEYFNKFAFVYVGLYGYSYLDAGKNVMTLFDLRGFSVIISDQLASAALSFMTISVGLITAGLGLLINKENPDWLKTFAGDQHGDGDKTISSLPAFAFGFLAGSAICHVIMAVIDSAVNTVLVCFAEAPEEFEENHPELSQKMREAWLQVYDFTP